MIRSRLPCRLAGAARARLRSRARPKIRQAALTGCHARRAFFSNLPPHSLEPDRQAVVMQREEGRLLSALAFPGAPRRLGL